MATTIVTKNSSTASAVPTAAQLVQGELAVNVADKRIYTENNVGGIVELGTNPSTLTVAGEITANGGIALGDNDKATFGAGVELQIYSDGTNAIIKEDTGGSLYIGGADVHLMNPAFTEYYISAVENGAVTLRHDNAAKLATTATGIDVTGTATMDGLVVDGKGILNTNYSFGQSNYHLKMGEDSGDSYLGNVNGSAFLATGNYYGSNQYTLTNGATALSGVYLDGSSGIQLFSEAGLTANSTVTRKQRLNVATNGDISFYEDTGTTAKLFWDASAESLGIGTSSPTYPLHVAGEAGIEIYNASGGGDVLNFRPSLGDANKYNLSISSYDHSGGGVGPADGLSINGFDGVSIATGSSTARQERMRIDSAGRVGIGTTSPSTRLHVNTGSAGYGITVAASSQTSGTYQIGIDSNSALAIYDTAATAQRLVLSNAGNVGIGTTTPSGGAVGGKVVHVQSSGETASVRVDRSDASTLGTLSITSGNTTNSIYSTGSKALSIHTNSVERMRIDSAGNVGIGTSSIANSLGWGSVVQVGGANPALSLRSTGGSQWDISNFGGTFNIYNGSTARFKIDSAGKVGIGTSSVLADTKVQIEQSGDSPQLLTLQDSGDLTSKMGIYFRSTDEGRLSVASGGALTFYVNGSSGTEAARIDSAGNLLVGTTNTSLFNATTGGGLLLVPNGATTIARSAEVALFLNRTGNSVGPVQAFRKDGTTVGSISVTASTTAYNTSSDQRLKDNIADADDAGSKIDAIQVRQYDWKVDGSHQDYGMIAQELQLVAPEAVSGDADSEEMMGVDYSKLVPMLIKEIQSLRNRVEQLEA